MRKLLLLVRKYANAQEFVDVMCPEKTLLDLFQEIKYELKDTFKNTLFTTNEEFKAFLKMHRPQKFEKIEKIQRKQAEILKLINQTMRPDDYPIYRNQVYLYKEEFANLYKFSMKSFLLI